MVFGVNISEAAAAVAAGTTAPNYTSYDASLYNTASMYVAKMCIVPMSAQWPKLILTENNFVSLFVSGNPNPGMDSKKAPTIQSNPA